MPKRNDEQPDLAELLRALEQAEKKLRLEGMQPYPIFFELRNRLQIGEIDLKEAVLILHANYPSNPPSVEEWDDIRSANPQLYYTFMDSLDPTLRELIETDPEAYYERLAKLETANNYVELARLIRSQEARH